MNPTEHLLTCLGEEGAEIAQQVSKINRFGIDDRNVLDPTGPTNRDRLLEEINDLIAVVFMLADAGVLPKDWIDPDAQQKKTAKVKKFMNYAARVGALQWPVGTRIRFLKNIVDVSVLKRDIVRATPGETGEIAASLSSNFYWATCHSKSGSETFTVNLDEFEMI